MKSSYKFAHLADCHVGAWREPKLRELTIKAFEKAVDDIINNNVEFVLIAGDLFHTPLPSIEVISKVTENLTKLKKKGIRVYAIPGSHDFSASGKTMLNVLEKAELLTIVSKAEKIYEDNKILLKTFEDKETGALITGVLGRRSGIEKEIFFNLDKDALERKAKEWKGLKIFLLHTALDVHSMKGMSLDTITPISELPKYFDYYAAGHIHKKTIQNLENELGGILSYPGPLMPDSFSELEEFETGGYYLVEVEENKIKNITWREIKVIDVVKINLDLSGLNIFDAKVQLEREVESRNVENKLVLFRLKGTLEQGRIQDLMINQYIHKLYSKGAYFVLRNISQLTTKEFDVVKKSFSNKKDLHELEEEFIKSHLGKKEVYFSSREFEVVKKLIELLGQEKREGETKATYEERVIEEVKKYFDV